MSVFPRPRALLAALLLASPFAAAQQPAPTPPQPSPPVTPAPPPQSPPATPASQQNAPPTQSPSPPAAEPEIARSDDPDAAESAATQVPLAEIRRYVAVYNAVKDAYVDPVDDKALMQSAIKGLLLDLDPHSAYLVRQDAEAYEEVDDGDSDNVAGRR